MFDASRPRTIVLASALRNRNICADGWPRITLQREGDVPIARDKREKPRPSNNETMEIRRDGGNV
jgi:hypothetical protein